MRIFVGNLPFDSKDEEFKALLQNLNLAPTRSQVIRDRTTGACRGFAFLDFPTAALGNSAIETLNVAMLGNRQLRASEAQERPGYRPGSAGSAPGAAARGPSGDSHGARNQAGGRGGRDQGGRGNVGRDGDRDRGRGRKGRDRDNYEW